MLNFLSDASPVVLILTLIISVFLWGAGYKLYKLAVFFLGFITGFAVSGFILGKIGASIPIPVIIIQILFGLALGAVSFMILKMGLFVTAACATFLILSSVLQHMEFTGMLIAFAAAVVAGFVATKADKPVIIVITAIIGAFLLPSAVLHIVAILPFDMPSLPGENTIIMIVIKVVLAVVGAMIQFSNSKEEEK